MSVWRIHKTSYAKYRAWSQRGVQAFAVFVNRGWIVRRTSASHERKTHGEQAPLQAATWLKIVGSTKVAKLGH